MLGDRDRRPAGMAVDGIAGMVRDEDVRTTPTATGERRTADLSVAGRCPGHAMRIGGRLQQLELTPQEVLERRRRPVKAGRFDRIVSVGMFEHVGVGHYRQFFETVARRLRAEVAGLVEGEDAIRLRFGPAPGEPRIERTGIVSDEGDVKLIDFAIAQKPITGLAKLFKRGKIQGTRSYMSPEQLAGKKIEGRSDLFSLGVTLYQLASGHLPFTGDSMAQLMFKIANEPHTDILTYAPILPQALVDIVNRSLAKDPEIIL